MSSTLINKIAKAVAVAPGIKIKRQLKIVIELEMSNGFSLEIKDHPANTHFKVHDGKRWEVFCRATYKWIPSPNGQVKGSRKVTRTFLYNDNIDKIAFEHGLIILNDWIALNPTCI